MPAGWFKLRRLVQIPTGSENRHLALLHSGPQRLTIINQGGGTGIWAAWQHPLGPMRTSHAAGITPSLAMVLPHKPKCCTCTYIVLRVPPERHHGRPSGVLPTPPLVFPIHFGPVDHMGTFFWRFLDGQKSISSSRRWDPHKEGSEVAVGREAEHELRRDPLDAPKIRLQCDHLRCLSGFWY